MVRSITDAATGDRIEVTTEDRTYEGVIVDFETRYAKSDTVSRGYGSADVAAIERDDGHRMYVYDYGDVVDLYTFRAKVKGGMSSNGSRAIVARDVSYTIDADDDTAFAKPEDVDLSDVEAGDVVTFRLADGTEYTEEVVDTDVNRHGRRLVVFDEPFVFKGEPDYRACRDLSANGAGEAITHADGDIAEPEFDTHAVVAIRVEAGDDSTEDEPEVATDGGVDVVEPDTSKARRRTRGDLEALADVAKDRVDHGHDDARVFRLIDHEWATVDGLGRVQLTEDGARIGRVVAAMRDRDTFDATVDLMGVGDFVDAAIDADDALAYFAGVRTVAATVSEAVDESDSAHLQGDDPLRFDARKGRVEVVFADEWTSRYFEATACPDRFEPERKHDERFRSNRNPRRIVCTVV